MSSGTILATKNEAVDQLNNEIMSSIPGTTFTLRSIGPIAAENQVILYHHHKEFLISLTRVVFPWHNLRKGGISRNAPPKLRPHERPPRYTVLNAADTLLTVVSEPSGVDAGWVLMIPRIHLQPSDAGLPFTLTRLQLPIEPVVAMSIKKSQGQRLIKTH